MRRVCIGIRVTPAACVSRAHSHLQNSSSGSSIIISSGTRRRSDDLFSTMKRSGTSFFSSSLLMTRRGVGVDLLSPLAKLGQSRDLAADIKAGRQRNNKEIIASFEKIQTFDAIHYRKTDRPWELVPKYAKKRVSDLCGLLSSEDRMEIEQAIDKMQSLCEVDMYVVLVPTVGYTTPAAFANSIMFDWGIGEPQGNGLLLLIAQHEANVRLVASEGIAEYFGPHFLEPAVREVFQPLVRDGRASYGTVQLVYAIARQAQEMRPFWQSRRGVFMIPLKGLSSAVGPVVFPRFLSPQSRHRVRRARRVVLYGFTAVPYLVAGVFFFAAATAVLVSQLMDTVCPDCHAGMHRVRDDATLQAVMPRGQYLEMVNGCAHYRVWKCPHCENSTRVVLTSRDLHQSTRCLQCMDCHYYTCSLEKEVLKLPTKDEDGLKQLLYKCENCRVGREVLLPLLRPIDLKPEEKWYDFLIERSQTHKNTDLKL
ncbi:TPM domain [Trypanosoma melophagium]|uniref:TPM domain n=1 Tax=Trypanosoma melophagium TaxID=715481 RepID=UPI00351A4FA9|nr:TPM domain [Trypanosoma melophagium]